jgi:ferredoxin
VKVSEGAVKVEANRDICIGSGMCLMAAPKVFDQELARRAVANCPSAALRTIES